MLKKKHKIYLKLNIISLFCIGVSFISITMAWFAYSGLASTKTDIDVKAWYIEFQKDNNQVSNEMVISLDEIYPGMDTVSEKIDIKNLGDSDAQISYAITEVRIFDEELMVNDDNFLEIEDRLSHDYPFNINIALSKLIAVSETGSSELNVTVSWPLDSGHDALDSKWGNDAYEFLKKEKEKLASDPNYVIKSPIKVVINVKAEQLIETDDALDPEFSLDNTVLYDVIENKRCQQLSETCIKTNVIDIGNKKSDSTVTLLPILFKDYINIDSWQATKRLLSIDDVLPIISQDVENSYLIRNNLSDALIGKINNDLRLKQILNETVEKNGSYKFLNSRFPSLATSRCIKLSSDGGNNFYLRKEDDVFSKIYLNESALDCISPYVIIVSKDNLNL